MRIIGGQSGGRILKVPKGLGVRPTPDLVKQAIFNSLGERVVGGDVLELFGGSGALSLESLSRGATSAVCVEKSAKHTGFIRRNFEQLGLPREQLELRNQDAYQAIAQFAANGRKFHLIFADPPYGEKNLGKRSKSHAQMILDDANLPMILHAGGLFVLGHSKRDVLEITTWWQVRKVLKHGDSLIELLELKPPT